MALRSLIFVFCSAFAAGFTVGPTASASVRVARADASMMAGLSPKGPFGGYAEGDSSEQGWLGDRSEGTQVKKFEAGEDYLFFQGPAPKTAVQLDLPSFFSAENFADLEISPLQIGVTVVGLGTFATVVPVLLS